MKNKSFSQCEINEKNQNISHGETKPKRKYTKRVRHAREIELELRCEVQAREIRYLKLKYAHMDAECLAARKAAVPVKPYSRAEYYHWVTDDDVLDYCAGHWLCHPTNRMFRLYLSHYGVYGRVQAAMRDGEWVDIVLKAAWVREFGGWRHGPVDGPYDKQKWLARQKKVIELVRPGGVAYTPQAADGAFWLPPAQRVDCA